MPRRRQPKPGEQLALDLAGVKPPRPPRVSGTRLNQWIIQHLVMRGCFAWRQNSGMAMMEDKETGRRQPVSFGFVGCPDVLGYAPDGRFIGIEGKVNDDLSPEQRAFLEGLQRAGGIALVVRPDDYQQKIDDALEVPASKRWTRKE